MITFFCPSCWKEIKKDDGKCPFCRADITEHEKKGFEEKLINALNHPERKTVQRAVWILGKLKSAKAVQPLIQLFKRTDDPYIKAEILDALVGIETPDALKLIRNSLNSEEIIVKSKAKKLVQKGKHL